jgi:hypothetical protein
MQRDGERARLEGTIPLWRTEHTGVSSAPFRKVTNGYKWLIKVVSGV